MDAGWRSMLRCNGIGLYGEDHADSRGHCALQAAYIGYLSAMPSLSTGDLLLPPNSRTLLYGTSYMGQIAHGILCGQQVHGPLRSTDMAVSFDRLNGRVDVHACTTREWQVLQHPSQLRSSSRPPPMPSMPPPLLAATSFGVEDASTNGCDIGYGTFQRFEAAHNVSIIVVANHETLQGHSALSERLLFGLLQWARFDHVLFMKPHPRCFFDFTHNKSLPHCVDLANLSGGTANADEPSTSPSGTLLHGGPWHVMKSYQRAEAPTMGLQQVLPWEDPGATREKQGVRYQASAALIDGNEFVAPHPCQMPFCRNASIGHQCVPGALTLMSRAAVQSVWRHREIGRRT